MSVSKVYNIIEFPGYAARSSLYRLSVKLSLCKPRTHPIILFQVWKVGIHIDEHFVLQEMLLVVNISIVSYGVVKQVKGQNRVSVPQS